MAEVVARGRIVGMGGAIWIEGPAFTTSPGWIGPLRYWKARRYAKRAGIQLEVRCPIGHGEHFVTFSGVGADRRFVVEHPGVRDTVCECPLQYELECLDVLVEAMSVGRYRAHEDSDGEWHLDPVTGGTDG